MTDPTDWPESATGSPVPAGLTVLSGPATGGKASVVRAIRDDRSAVWLSVQVTTREPRLGEVEGGDYLFVSQREFDELVAAEELLEWARYAGHRYGTPRGPVAGRRNAGIPVLIDVDIAGAWQVRAAVPEALLVFLAPPATVELASRPASCREGSEFDITLVNTSVQDASTQLVALMTGQPARLPAR